MKKLSLIFIGAIFLASCLTQRNFWQSNNSVQNVYMLNQKQVAPNTTYTDPIMRISRMEPYGDSVRLYTHIIDSDNSFIAGAAAPNYQNLWCTLEVNNSPVSGYTVREVFEDSNIPTVYALVLDHSGSMGGKVNKMQDAVRAFINKKKPQDAICIVKYDSHTALEVPVNTNSMVLQNMFKSNGLQGYGGTTAILNGIITGIDAIKTTPYRRKVVISFTDGADNSSTITKEFVTWAAQQNNINLCTIDFNNSPYNNFMPELANVTGGTYTYFNNSNDFNFVFDDIVNKMNHSYVVTYKKLTDGPQSVMLRYCAEPTALEAHGEFNTVRSPDMPIRDVPRPIIDRNVASADQPIYTRPTTNYPVNNNNATVPIKGSPVTNPARPGSGATTIGGLKGDGSSPSNGGNVGRPIKPDTSPADNSGSVKPGSSNGVNNGSSNTNIGSGTKPPPANGNNNGSTKPDTSPADNGGNVKPGSSSGVSNGSSNSNMGSGTKPPPANENNNGGSTKPDTSPADNGGNVKPGSSKGVSNGSSNSNMGSGTKPPPANENNNGGSTKPDTSPADNGGNVKPGSSKGVSNGSSNSNMGSGTKPPPANENNNGGSTKPDTSPADNGGNVKPGSSKGVSNGSSNTNVGSGTKPPPANGNNSGSNTKPSNKPATNSGSTKPVSSKPTNTSTPSGNKGGSNGNSITPNNGDKMSIPRVKTP